MEFLNISDYFTLWEQPLWWKAFSVPVTIFVPHTLTTSSVSDIRLLIIKKNSWSKWCNDDNARYWLFNNNYFNYLNILVSRSKFWIFRSQLFICWVKKKKIWFTDTTFMYAISMLCMLKIYQTRHPDINADAHAAFGVLAFVVFLGVLSVFEDCMAFRVAFAGIHLLACLALSVQVYYMGRWKLSKFHYLKKKLISMTRFKYF